MKYTTLFIAIFVVALGLMQMSAAKATFFQIDYTNVSQQNQKDPLLVIQTLKYEPYPVNAGDWFDLWFKVQNIGQNDANNVSFELLSEYPFSSNDSVRDYGLIYGKLNAYKVDQTYDASQIILKFRVKVADNAPAGENIIKLKAMSDNATNTGRIYSFPIAVAKTKTDFDIIIQDSTSQGTSFALANIGENDATAVVVSIEPQEHLNLTGATSSMIGNLAKGDFTTVTFQLFPGKGADLKVQIAYTDTAGIRNTVEKTVTVNANPSLTYSNGRTTNGVSRVTTGTPGYTYLVVGLVAGLAIAFVYTQIRQKRK